MVDYREPRNRKADAQYRTLLLGILNSGKRVTTSHGPALKLIAHRMRFDLRNGFPLITERDIVTPPESGKPPEYQQALGEICAFLNGAQTQSELEEFGCYWWDRWTTPENCAKFGLPPGDLGPASYGAAWRRFPTGNGGTFDQISSLIEQIKQFPHLRYHEVTPWIPQWLTSANGQKPRAVVPPCHGWFHVHISDEGELTLTHRQRSGDAPVGLAYNLVHYAALTMMIAQVTGYRAREFVQITDDVHIYTEFEWRGRTESQVPYVKAMLEETRPRRFPTMTIDPSVTDLFAFRRAHFQISDYPPALKRRIPTPL